jgi:hypothetical protein
MGNRSIAIAWLVFALGCRSPGGKVGGAMTGLGVVAMFPVGIACADYDDGQPSSCDGAVGALAAGVVVVAVFGGLAVWIYSEATYDPAAAAEAERIAAAAPPVPEPMPPREATIPPLHEPIAARDPMARQLTMQAHAAAFRGQCASVVAVGGRVQKLDREYHARVFVLDPAIAKCLK